MTVTIRFIAEAAKVSRGTVDKVLNDRPGVSQEVRVKVKKIAEELGYKPNLAGKALAFRKNPLKIGVIILNGKDHFFLQIMEGVKQASNELKDLGVSVEYLIMDSYNVQQQLQCIKTLCDKNISALAISPLDEEIIREELMRLNAGGIKIITFNTDISGIERLCFIGQDLIKSGRVAGQLLGEILPQGGKIAIFTGIDKIKALQERIMGFRLIIEKEYPKIEIIEIIKDIKDNEDSYIKAKDTFQKYESLEAVFVTGRGIGGVGRAIDEMDRSVKKPKFICFDTIPETIELLKKGIVGLTITQEPFMQGYLPIKTFFEYFYLNNTPSKEYMYTKLEIKTKENYDI